MANDTTITSGGPDPVPDAAVDGLNNDNRKRDFRFALASGLFFVIASVLYLWLGINDLDYFNMIKDVPNSVLNADDDYSWEGYVWEDDYVFKAHVWVTRSQILYFSAALCFVIVGFMDFIYKPGHLFGVALILAGLSGLVSAMLVEKDPWLSSIFNSISVHLYALEGAELLFWRPPVATLKYWPRIGDLFFLWGALIDVALSYPIVWETYDIEHAPFSILAACTWLVSSLINMGDIVFLKKHGTFGQPDFLVDKQAQVEALDPAEADRGL